MFRRIVASSLLKEVAAGPCEKVAAGSGEEVVAAPRGGRKTPKNAVFGGVAGVLQQAVKCVLGLGLLAAANVA